ncbi:MAG: MBL fold metallo-hydrolase [Pseudomonadota bacterium]
MSVKVDAFFDEATNSVSYLVSDPSSGDAMIIDPVLDFDAQSACTRSYSADKILAAVNAASLTVRYCAETHIHADHLSAGHYLKSKLGCQLLASARLPDIQDTFEKIYNVTVHHQPFDRLLEDAETLPLGTLRVTSIATPGHTPACMTLRVGDCAFVGDTLFMPDYGTARCDFPGGDAKVLYQSIHRIFDLPEATRVFTAHDYLAPGRSQYAWESSVGEQKRTNIHIGGGRSEQDFITLRTSRDRSLAIPKLMLPAVQVNIRAGQIPPAEGNGVQYLKIPVNTSLAHP